jgi:putative phosphoribosyl transferase
MAAFFDDRLDAGRRLGEALQDFSGKEAVVVGLARGGVVVGYAAARYLYLPLTVLVVRKLGAPGNPELAIGAVSETGVRWVDPVTCASTGADDMYVRAQVQEQVEEARNRRQVYTAGTALGEVRGRSAIVVDDGIATGATALVGLRSVRELGASYVALATPVASSHAVELLRPEADEVVTIDSSAHFAAVGLYYADFGQVGDDEVIRYLNMAEEALQEGTGTSELRTD